MVKHLVKRVEAAPVHFLRKCREKEFIDHMTSMITDEDPLQGLLFYYQEIGFSHTLHVLRCLVLWCFVLFRFRVVINGIRRPTQASFKKT